MSENVLSEIKAQLPTYLDFYIAGKPWMDEVFQDKWSLPTNLQVIEIRLIESRDPAADLENTKILYGALRGLKVSQAVDERLWAYLTHGPFWNYVQSRWPIRGGGDRTSKVSQVTERYFFIGNRSRALVRNAVARLWWFGHMTYDETRDDPFELTEILLSSQRTAHDLLERGYTRNRRILRAFLEALRDAYGTDINTEAMRAAARHLTWAGGVSVLDALSEDGLKSLILRGIA